MLIRWHHQPRAIFRILLMLCSLINSQHPVDNFQLIYTIHHFPHLFSTPSPIPFLRLYISLVVLLSAQCCLYSNTKYYIRVYTLWVPNWLCLQLLAMIFSQSPSPFTSLRLFRFLSTVAQSIYTYTVMHTEDTLVSLVISANGATKLLDALQQKCFKWKETTRGVYSRPTLLSIHRGSSDVAGVRYKDHSCHFAMTKLCPEFHLAYSPFFSLLLLEPTWCAHYMRILCLPSNRFTNITSRHLFQQKTKRKRQIKKDSYTQSLLVEASLNLSKYSWYMHSSLSSSPIIFFLFLFSSLHRFRFYYGYLYYSYIPTQFFCFIFNKNHNDDINKKQ